MERGPEFVLALEWSCSFDANGGVGPLAKKNAASLQRAVCKAATFVHSQVPNHFQDGIRTLYIDGERFTSPPQPVGCCGQLGIGLTHVSAPRISSIQFTC